MPQGVEHLVGSINTSKSALMLQPLMPQGVEHKCEDIGHYFGVTMLQPLMPQGVEHHRPIWMRGPQRNVTTSDAARR